MLGRQRSGSAVCPSCGRLVGVSQTVCPHCGRRYPGLFGFSRLLQAAGQDLGFVQLIIGACAVLYVATLAVDASGIRMGGVLGMLAPSHQSLLRFGASGNVPVFVLDRWWTVLSASWLHGGLLHILFNMLWVRNLAPATARIYGPGRMVLIYLVAGVCGFLLSSLAGRYLGFMPGPLRGAQLTIGASASIFGLLGALVLYGRRAGGGAAVGQQAWTWALILFLFGFIMWGVDNFAHLGGFVGGYLMARWLNPLLPEKTDHLLGALVGLVLSLVAIVLSLIAPVPI